MDLVQEFDAKTAESMRSVVDVDFDGTADLLVLFQDGRAVFAKWASHVARVAVNAGAAPRSGLTARAADAQLTPLEDPFRSDLSVRAVRGAVTSGDCVELSASGGLPASSTDLSDPPSPCSVASGPAVSHLRSAFVVPYSPARTSRRPARLVSVFILLTRSHLADAVSAAGAPTGARGDHVKSGDFRD